LQDVVVHGNNVFLRDNVFFGILENILQTFFNGTTRLLSDAWADLLKNVLEQHDVRSHSFISVFGDANFDVLEQSSEESSVISWHVRLDFEF